MTTFLDIHAIQSVPFSNLNRDDQGLNKTVMFGGVSRVRVSSQSWKRATRMAAEAAIDDPSYRSRCAALDIHDVLTTEHGWDTELAMFAGRKTMSAAGFALNAPKKRVKAGAAADTEEGDEDQPYTTKILLWYPRSAIVDLAKLCITHRDALTRAHEAAENRAAKKRRKTPSDVDAQAAADDTPEARLEAAIAADDDPKGSILPEETVRSILIRTSSSINLFGRFLAELPEGNVDGAVSVQHAFTTHPGSLEMDYFVAVDDRQTRGTGHLATAAFAAGTFYRYASINIDDLARNLGGDVDEAIKLAGTFAYHFTTSLPSGKQHSTAAFSLPALVHTVVRTDRAVSYDTAFEGPVKAGSDGGYTTASCVALSRFADNVARFLGTDGRPFHGHVALEPQDGLTTGLGTSYEALPDLISGTQHALHEATSGAAR